MGDGKMSLQPPPKSDHFENSNESVTFVARSLDNDKKNLKENVIRKEST